MPRPRRLVPRGGSQPPGLSRLKLDWMQPTVLVNHSLLRRPCGALFYPEILAVVRNRKTADWHTATTPCVRSTDTHIPRTTWYDGVPEVSVGCTRGSGAAQAYSGWRVLPVPIRARLPQRPAVTS